MRTRKNLVRRFIAVLSVAALAGTLVSSAQASDCNERHSGYLVAKDYANPNMCTIAHGNFMNWGSFGWNDRADFFRNDHSSWNVCVYQHDWMGGSFVHLSPGERLEWRNTVTSNRWTTSVNCPR